MREGPDPGKIEVKFSYEECTKEAAINPLYNDSIVLLTSYRGYRPVMSHVTEDVTLRIAAIPSEKAA